MPEALRDVYGRALKACAMTNKKVIALDADLAGSTKSGTLLPELQAQHFNVGIAEANMTAMAAGLASCGFIPFINTFATVATSNGLLAIKSMIAYSSLEVRIIGSNTGLGGGYDGATHHSFDDVNVMRAIPGMKVLVPSDAHMLTWAVGELADCLGGPVYMGVSRHASENLYSESEQFKIGKAVRLRQGTDLTIIACGMMVARAKKAAEELEKKGISAAVLDMFTVKPLDRQAVIHAAVDTGAIVTAEEHSIVGGLGSAVLETIAEEGICVPCTRVGIKDCYTESGSYAELVERYCVGVEAILQAAVDVFDRKRRKENE